VLKTDGQLVRPDAIVTFPHFVMIRDRLYRLSRDTQSGEEVSQLLVPKSHRETIFQAADHSSGHLGCYKTCEWIMAQFYWLDIYAGVRPVTNVSYQSTGHPKRPIAANSIN